MVDIQFGIVPLEFDLWFMLKNTVQSSSEVMGNTALPPPLVVLLYSIAKDGPFGDIKPLQRYVKADLPAYAFKCG